MLQYYIIYILVLRIIDCDTFDHEFMYVHFIFRFLVVAFLKYLLAKWSFTLKKVLHYLSLSYVTIHYVTLHYTALHCIALHCIALHYIH